jgi:hypothetical protein
MVPAGVNHAVTSTSTSADTLGCSEMRPLLAPDAKAAGTS